MSWVAEATFDDLNVATINGQAGGSGFNTNWGALGSYNPGNINVVSTPTYEGTRAVQMATGGESAERGLAATLGGNGNILYVALRRTNTTAGGDGLRWVFASAGDATRLKVALVDGALKLIGSTSVTLVGTYAVDTWYVVRVTINVTSNTATAAVSTDAYGSAGAFGSESSAVTMASSGNIDRIYCAYDKAGYVDYVSPTSPFISVTTPTVTTQAVSSIGTTTATGNGNVTDDGGAEVTERGVCVSTSANPTTADDTFQAAAGGEGAFTASITGRARGTLYHVRAYAINTEGTSYGADVEFTTTDPEAIFGVVSLSGVPVEGATVRCIRQSDNVALAEETTDVDGAYTFSGLDSAELYHLAVEYVTGGVKYNALSLWDVVPVDVV